MKIYGLIKAKSNKNTGHHKVLEKIERVFVQKEKPINKFMTVWQKLQLMLAKVAVEIWLG